MSSYLEMLSKIEQENLQKKGTLRALCKDHAYNADRVVYSGLAHSGVGHSPIPAYHSLEAKKAALLEFLYTRRNAKGFPETRYPPNFLKADAFIPISRENDVFCRIPEFALDSEDGDVGELLPLAERLNLATIVCYRTSLPALAGSKEVAFNFHRQSWTAVPGNCPLPLRIAGFAVHMKPPTLSMFQSPFAHLSHISTMPWQILQVGITLDKLPSDENLRQIRDLFPGSSGCRVMRAGYIDVLFPSTKIVKSMQKRCEVANYDLVIQPESPFVNVFSSGLPFRYRFVAQSTPVATTITPQQVAMKPKTRFDLNDKDFSEMPRGCLGVKLSMQGYEYFTTVTHGIVRKRSTETSSAFITRLFDKVRHWPSSIWGGKLPSGPILLGSTLYLAGPQDVTNQKLGTVVKCYDNYSKDCLEWPTDFRHDLSLIGNSEGFPSGLPAFTSTNLPHIDKHFMLPEEVWAGHDGVDWRCYIAMHDVYNDLENLYLGTVPRAQESLITGWMATWAPNPGATTARKQTSPALRLYQRSFLWRTTSRVGNDDSPDRLNLEGCSGATLCIGDHRSKVPSRAALFQNFQCQILTSEDVDYPETTWVQGGIMLPDDILKAEILHTASQRVELPNSHPRVSISGRLEQLAYDRSLPVRIKPPHFALGPHKPE